MCNKAVRWLDAILRHRRVRVGTDGENAIKALVAYIKLKRSFDTNDFPWEPTMPNFAIQKLHIKSICASPYKGVAIHQGIKSFKVDSYRLRLEVVVV